MATKKKGILATSGEWWKHLRWTKRDFWKKHRRIERQTVRALRREMDD